MYTNLNTYPMKAKVFANASRRDGDFLLVEVLEVRSPPAGKPNKNWSHNDVAMYNLNQKGIESCLVKYEDGSLCDNVWINKLDITMKDSLKEDLKSLVCEGNVAKLPTDKLNDYAALKKALVKINGKYKRNTFVFPIEAQKAVDELLKGETTDFKKKYQFFATPPELADRMAQDIVFDKPEMRILEPGAGHGALIDAVLRVKPLNVELIIEFVELSDLNFDVLKGKYSEDNGVENMAGICGDFMGMDMVGHYDLIIANPPFTKNQDIDHIRKMYDLLAPGGRIITLSSKSWYQGSQKKQVAFRDWLDNDVAACYSELDNGVFKSSGTNVAGMYIVIDK
jgi:phospholipid N-methyltransferase